VARQLIRETPQPIRQADRQEGGTIQTANKSRISGAVIKGRLYAGEHVALHRRKVWDKEASQFLTNPRKRSGPSAGTEPSLLKGLIFGPTVSICRSKTRKNGTALRYLRQHKTVLSRERGCPIGTPFRRPARRKDS